MTEKRPTLRWVAVDKPATEDLDPESADLKLPPGATDYTKPKDTR
ncbi:hypothetical protein AB0C10_37590 [Microbispora amethystogenes]